jgi:hypothetical protein
MDSSKMSPCAQIVAGICLSWERITTSAVSKVKLAYSLRLAMLESARLEVKVSLLRCLLLW